MGIYLPEKVIWGGGVTTSLLCYALNTTDSV